MRRVIYKFVFILIATVFVVSWGCRRKRTETTIIGHWRMDDDMPETSVFDSSRYGGNGTAQQSTAAMAVPGKIGSALQFNGVDDNVEVADSAALSPTTMVSISAWVKFNRLGEETGIVWKGGFNYLLIQAVNKVVFYVYDSGGSSSIASFLEADLISGWNHIVATFDGIYSRIYLNGVLKDTGDAISGIRDQAGSLYIGRRGDSYGDIYFDGAIDNVLIYHGFLRQHDVDFFYNAGRGTEDTNTVATHGDGVRRDRG